MYCFCLYCLNNKKETISIQWQIRSGESTHRACAHNTLVLPSGWEEVVLGEGLPWSVNATIIATGRNWSPEAGGNLGLIWEDTHSGQWSSLAGHCGQHGRGRIVYLRILGSTAGARPLGYHRTRLDTGLRYISHGLSKTKTPTVNSSEDTALMASAGLNSTSVHTHFIQNINPKGSRKGCQLSPGL